MGETSDVTWGGNFQSGHSFVWERGGYEWVGGTEERLSLQYCCAVQSENFSAGVVCKRICLGQCAKGYVWGCVQKGYVWGSVHKGICPGQYISGVWLEHCPETLDSLLLQI